MLQAFHLSSSTTLSFCPCIAAGLQRQHLGWILFSPSQLLSLCPASYSRWQPLTTLISSPPPSRPRPSRLGYNHTFVVTQGYLVLGMLWGRGSRPCANRLGVTLCKSCFRCGRTFCTFPLKHLRKNAFIVAVMQCLSSPFYLELYFPFRVEVKLGTVTVSPILE